MPIEIIPSDKLKNCPLCAGLGKQIQGRLLKSNFGYAADCPRCPRATDTWYAAADEAIENWNSFLEGDELAAQRLKRNCR